MKKDVLIAVVVGVLFLALGFFFMNRNLQKASKIEQTMQAIVTPVAVDTTKPAPKNQTPSAAKPAISLAVVAPSSVTENMVTISGTTVPGAEVSVNDKDVVADSAGKFSTKVSLLEGENYISVIAIAATGEYLEREVIVTYNP